MFLQPADEHQEQRLAEDISYAIECGAQADIGRLIVFGERQHIVAIRSYIVRGRTESSDSE